MRFLGSNDEYLFLNEEKEDLSTLLDVKNERIPSPPPSESGEASSSPHPLNNIADSWTPLRFFHIAYRTNSRKKQKYIFFEKIRADVQKNDP